MSCNKMDWIKIFKSPNHTVTLILASIFLVEIVLVQPPSHSNENGNKIIVPAFAQGPPEEIIPLDK